MVGNSHRRLVLLPCASKRSSPMHWFVVSVERNTMHVSRNGRMDGCVFVWSTPAVLGNVCMVGEFVWFGFNEKKEGRYEGC